MFWLTFIAYALVLYLPPFYLAGQLWQEARDLYWWLPLLGWRFPAWLAYISWLVLVYALLGGLALLLALRLPEELEPARTARRLAGAGLGWPGALVTAAAVGVILLAWPILPLARATYGWRLGISTPTVALAVLYLVAEALRLAEHSLWTDRAFEAWRRIWLREQGYR